jgi:ATP-dependent Clp protease protease subunit
MLIPMVLENEGRQERSWDLMSRLMRDRIIFAHGNVDEHMAQIVVAQLLYLESADPERAINIYISSYGGNVNAGISMIDVIRFISCRVNTVCVGYCMSMGAMLLASGTGVRSALPGSRIMIHEVSAGNSGKATDMEISMNETLYLKNKLNEMLAEYTKQPLEFIEKSMIRDKYMSAEEAKAFGIIDTVITKRSPVNA